jgi:type VI secretion system protein
MACPRPQRLVWLAWLALGLLCACGPITLKTTVIVDPDANAYSPVSMSLLIIHRRDLLEKVQALSAKQWFQQREQLLRDLGKDADEAMWEYVPGQQAPPISLKVRRSAVQGFLFANYRSPGPHRYAFDPRLLTQITCGQRGLALQSTTSMLDTLRGLRSKIPTEKPEIPQAPPAPEIGAFK